MGIVALTVITTKYILGTLKGILNDAKIRKIPSFLSYSEALECSTGWMCKLLASAKHIFPDAYTINGCSAARPGYDITRLV